MMAKKETSSVELFREFQPRFSEITWYADKLIGESLLLTLGYRAQRIPIPFMVRNQEETIHLWWSGREAGRKDNRPAFNFREGKLAFNFVFDPSNGMGTEDQLKMAMIRAVYDGPFKERRFFMGPSPETSCSWFCHLFRIPIEFRTDDRGPIPGLRLGEAVAYDWKFFIPGGPKRAAIQAAVDLERVQSMQEAHRKEYPELGTVDELRARLDKCLTHVF